jgi:hypothetical protein
MVARLTKNEIQLLKELTAAGEHGRVISTLTSSARSQVAPFEERAVHQASGTKLYVITKRGLEALKTMAD